MARTTSRQLSEWIAYRRVELLPDERVEMLLASIAALLANMWRGEDDEPVQPREFMPWLPEDEEGESEPADMSAMIDMLKTVFGAIEVTDDGPQDLSEDDENWEP